jgi:SNF2 family DNA or RNA helicase
MFLKIDNKKLNSLVPSEIVQKEGAVLKDSVKNLKYDYESHNIHAVVDDHGILDVSINFDQTGEFQSYTCACENGKATTPCRHTLAVLLKTQEKFLQRKGDLEVVTQDTSKLPKIKPWSYPTTEGKKVHCGVSNKYFYESTSLPYVDIEIKLGVERLYTIKDIRKLLDSIDTYDEYPLGKVFAFDFHSHALDEKYTKLLKFLLKIYRTEKSLLRVNEGHGFMWNTGTNPLSCFKGKVVRLGGDLLYDYLDTLLGHDINLSFNDGEFFDYKIVEDDIDILLNRAPAKEGMLLSVIFKNNIVPLMPDYSFVLNVEDKLIIKIPEEKKNLLIRLFLEISSTGSNSFVVSKEYFEEFNGHIFPFLKKNGITITTTSTPVKSNRISGFLARAHFDIFKKGIVAGVRFIYGKTVINPFDQNKSVSSYISNRNHNYESTLLKILYNIGFEEYSGRLLLQDVDKIADFIHDNFSKIKNNFDYSLSEKFSQLQIYHLKQFSFDLTLENGNTPVIHFETELNDEDLADLIASINLNKRYHFAKNGALIPIDNPEYRSLSGLLSNLGIRLRDIHDKQVLIPINKLPFLNSYIHEKGVPQLKITKDLEKTVQELTTQSSQIKPPPSINATLRDYQITGFNWLKTLSKYNIGGILADDMGLGKTLQVLTFIKSEIDKTNLPSIVIAPTSLIFNWYDESVKFVPDLKTMVISGTKTERSAKIEQINQYDLIVTSFGLLKNDIEQYETLQFNYCIVDEAQNIKNPQTLNADSVKKIKAKCCFALTGTPVENNLIELWSIFDFVLPGHLPSYNKFVQSFEKPISRDNDRERIHQLSEYIRPFVLRRLKKDVLKELPEKIESVISTRMTLEQEQLYNAFLGKGISEIKKHLKSTGFDKSRFEILALLTRLRQICAHPSLFIDDYPGGSGKLELLFDILENSLRNDHRVLVFSQFSTMLDLIKVGLEERGVHYLSLDGKTPSNERTEMSKRFNEGEASVFLISLKAGGTGLNLTGADVVIHFDPWWNPAVEDQASDRAYRIGQTRAVQIFKLITHNTIEEKIYHLQQKKKDLIQSIIKSGEFFEDTLTEDDILEILDIYDD